MTDVSGIVHRNGWHERLIPFTDQPVPAWLQQDGRRLGYGLPGLQPYRWASRCVFRSLWKP